MYKGSCLCGAVNFHINGEIDNIVYCHCSRCRKAQGSAFATNGSVKEAHFEFITGEDNLSEYEANEGHKKYFCTTCGSPVMSLYTWMPGKVRIRLGTIEGDITERPVAHIFATSKANWENITDELPQYEGYIPEQTSK